MADDALAMWLERAGASDVFPPIAREALRVARDPSASFRDFAAIVGRDAAVALRVLRLANSPFFGLPRRASTLTEALVVLGLRDALSLVLAVAVGAGNLADPWARRQWHHAVRTGALSRLLLVRAGADASGPAFLAGCLHDVGVRVFMEVAPETCRALLDRWGPHGPGLLAAEREAFGVDHASVGGACLAAWRFDPRLVEAVVNHHRPCTPASTRLSAAVRLADRIDGAVEAGLAAGEAIHRASRTPAAARLGLDAIDLSIAAAGLGGGSAPADGSASSARRHRRGG